MKMTVLLVILITVALGMKAQEGISFSHGSWAEIKAEGLLYCFGFSGKFELIKPSATGFETKGSFQVGDDDYNHWAHPVIKDGRLYIRHKETLWVYQIGKE